jgi:hypothetical protein
MHGQHVLLCPLQYLECYLLIKEVRMLDLWQVVKTHPNVLLMNFKLDLLVLEFVYAGVEKALITHFNIYLT